MRASISFTCERCGAVFGSRMDCLRHEAQCGDFPEDGLYRSKVGGMTAFFRVDRDGMRVVRVLIADTHLSMCPLTEWIPPEDLEPVSEANALIGIHGSFSDLEGSVLSVLGLPPYGRQEASGSAKSKGAKA